MDLNEKALKWTRELQVKTGLLSTTVEKVDLAGYTHPSMKGTEGWRVDDAITMEGVGQRAKKHSLASYQTEDHQPPRSNGSAMPHRGRC